MAGKRKAEPAALACVESCGAPCHHWRRFAESRKGQCRRFPPVPLASAGQAWPVTDAEDWCGEFADALKPVAGAV